MVAVERVIELSVKGLVVGVPGAVEVGVRGGGAGGRQEGCMPHTSYIFLELHSALNFILARASAISHTTPLQGY